MYLFVEKNMLIIHMWNFKQIHFIILELKWFQWPIVFPVKYREQYFSKITDSVPIKGMLNVSVTDAWTKEDESNDAFE